MDQAYGDRIIYVLPENKKALYQKLFLHMERRGNEFGISSMYITSYELNHLYMDLTANQSKRNTMPNVDKFLSSLYHPTIAVQRKGSVMRGLLYKKLLYQAPNVVPLIIMFLALLLILIVHEMSQYDASYARIEMGFSPQHGMEILRSRNDCKYLEISDLDNSNILTFTWTTQKWLISDLKCGNSTYREALLSAMSTYNSFGAIEKDGQESHINLWINERIFHSAALTLNLAHNIILK